MPNNRNKNASFLSESRKLQIEIENLSTQLKEMQQGGPAFHELDQMPSQLSMQKRKSERGTSYSSGREKQKIRWNASAMIWTRDQSPSFLIPKTKRFPKQKSLYPGFYPELSPNLRGTIKKGIKFSKDPRHQLFSFQITPSPHDYRCKRYLETSQSRRLSAQSKFQTVNPEQTHSNHIRGGAIGKFNNHWAVYYPHTDRRLYNERLLKQAQDARKMTKSKKRQKKMPEF